LAPLLGRNKDYLDHSNRGLVKLEDFKVITSILALIGITFSIIFIFSIFRRDQFHPAIFFVILAIVDVFFPAIYWTLFGQVNNPEWLPLLTADQLYPSVAYYLPFLFIFISCFICIDRCKAPQKNRETLPVDTQARIAYAVWFFLALTLTKIGLEIGNYGGLEPWMWSRVMSEGLSNSNAAQDGWFSIVPARELFQAVMGLAFYYRKQVNNKWLFTVFFPTVAIILAMLTFLRGAVLGCAITLLFSEVIRQQSLRRHTASAIRFGKKSIFLVGIIVATVSSMYVYGTIRDSFRGSLDGREDNSVEFVVPTLLTAGHGLLGLSHIVANYGQSVNFLWGKTYIDMFLLPIPRSIYTTKPAWYGIDDITRGMGWPESTQSAVTIPGEAYANFGLLGLFVAVPLGIAFGFLRRAVISNQIRFLLMTPVISFQVVSVANWMSLTGIMNSVSTLGLLFVLAVCIDRGGVRLLSMDWSKPRLVSAMNKNKAL
jgi:hypothetical protein